jgi:hypothetical protein
MFVAWECGGGIGWLVGWMGDESEDGWTGGESEDDGWVLTGRGRTGDRGCTRQARIELGWPW